VGRGIDLIVPPEKREELERIMESIRQGRRVNSLFTERLCKGGGRIPVSVSVTPLRGDDGRVIAASTIGRDMSRRIEIEHNLQRRLDEKELLLGELHHRVKNNLNIIASLLRLHLDTLETDNDSVAILRSCLNRVYAMAFVHESMYSREHCSSVRIGRYLELLLKHLTATFPHLEQLRIERCCSGLELNIAQAIPLGIILNELLSNVALHAGTPETELQCIRVEVSAEACSEGNRVRFKVRDDGRGLPEELNPAESGSLGLVLVRALADQLGGRVAWRRGGGTTVEGSFINDPEFNRRREAAIAAAAGEGEKASR
jgi:two-component sensor histidine kinase